MPVANELTEEERAEFAQHGVEFGDDAPVVVAEEAAPTAPAENVVAANAVAEVSTGEANGAIENATSNTAEAAATGEAERPAQTVPLAALHAERLKTAELARQNQLAQTRLNALLIQRQSATTVPQGPTLEQDPQGYLEHMNRQLAEMQQQNLATEQNRQIDNALEDDERNYTIVQADYTQASQHYVKSRGEELLMFTSPQEAQRIMADEVREIARQSWQRGVPASETIYKLAQARGYVPGGRSYTPGGARVERPEMPAGAPATPGAVLASVKAAQGAGKSLSGSGGSGAGPVTADALLAMSDAEFERYLKLGTRDANALFESIGGS